MSNNRLELLKRKIIRRSPEEEDIFLKKVFKEKLGMEIDSKRAAVGSSTNKYAIGLSTIIILTSAFLLIFIHPVIYVMLLLLIAMSCIVFLSNAMYFYFDDEKIIRVQEKGFCHLTHQIFSTCYQDIHQIEINSRSRKGLTTRNYRIEMRDASVLSFNLSLDTSAILINRFEIYLKKVSSKYGFTISS